MSDTIKERKLIIHAGLPKTATTSFQELLFQKLYEEDKINFSGAHMRLRNGKKANRYKLYSQILYPKNKSKSLNLLNNVRFPINIYSEENLTVPTDLVYSGGKEPLMELSYIPQALYDYFKNTYLDIKILITLRSQKSMIPSHYVQYFKMYSNTKQIKSPDAFLNFVFSNKKQFNTWYYDELLAAYSSIFGEDNIKVLLYEDLKNNKQKYYKSWTDILDLDIDIDKYLANERLNVKEAAKDGKILNIRKKTLLGKLLSVFLRGTGLSRKLRNSELWYNSKIMKYISNKTHSRPQKVFVRDFTKEELRMIYNHFKLSNTQLVGKYGLTKESLEKYGYI